MFHRSFSIGLCFAILASPLAAQDGDIIAPEIAFLEAGIVCDTITTSTRDAPDTDVGYIDVMDETPDFISNSTVVPLVPGIHFGVRSAIASDVPLDGVTIHTYHPPFLDSGTTHQHYQSSMSSRHSPSMSVYGFDFDHEMVTGTWTFEAEYQGYVLYRVNFEVVPPEQVPELAEACNYQDLLF